MGGYVLEDGRKLQTHEYIEYLEDRLEGALFLTTEEKRALLECVDFVESEGIARPLGDWEGTLMKAARQKLEESLSSDS